MCFVLCLYTFPPPIIDFLFVCRTTNFIERFLRIHPVQSVVNSIAQLSGRGFPRIFHMKLVLSQLYVFLVLQMEVGPCNLKGQYIKKRVGRPIIIKTLFLTKVSKRNSVPDAVVGALRSLDIVVRQGWPADND